MLKLVTAKTAEHYDITRELFVEYADQLGHDLCFQDFQHELEDLAGVYAPPNARVLLAAVEQQWIGCVAMKRFDHKICEMKRLFVRPPFRRRGLGRRLALEIIAIAHAAGYERMRLDTLASMSTARALYESLGFREIERYYDNPIAGVVFYELALKPPP
ncbi:MAG: GNAT family N-acetyltransferase [Planctomycetota bacterium]